MGKTCVALLSVISGLPLSVLRVLDAMVFTRSMCQRVLYVMYMHLINDAMYKEGSTLLISNVCLIASYA